MPVRYRFRSAGRGGAALRYTRAHGWALAARLPAFVALAAVLVASEETAPLTLVRLRGPSMIPTMNPDVRDVWLSRSYDAARTWRRLFFGAAASAKAAAVVPPNLRRGDVVGFAHPSAPHRTSCKRVVGLPGDHVQRYGQYAHLYVEQDGAGWGIAWPTDPADAWMDRSCPWDVDGGGGDNDNAEHDLPPKRGDAERTLVVPAGHVWLEADCPALGVDSRQCGPVPAAWLRGRIVARLWPLVREHKAAAAGNDWRRRPHPIALDDETLQEYGIYRR